MPTTYLLLQKLQELPYYICIEKEMLNNKVTHLKSTYLVPDFPTGSQEAVFKELIVL